MRHLVKNPKPRILEEQADKWREELLAILLRGEKPTKAMKERYRHNDIKVAIVAETHGKCAYCESKVRHITHGDIEHIVPKSKVPAKAYDWDNLTLACDVCNGNKGDYYVEDSEEWHDNLVDPYVDQPADHFLFMREIVSPRPDSLRGFATDAVIKLGRGELLEKRRERMEFLDGLVRAYSLADERYKELLLKDLYDNHLKDSHEYSASSNAYIVHLRSIGAI
jgi:uncharacterized protein (TIGR02646 family)